LRLDPPPDEPTGQTWSITLKAPDMTVADQLRAREAFRWFLRLKMTPDRSWLSDERTELMFAFLEDKVEELAEARGVTSHVLRRAWAELDDSWDEQAGIGLRSVDDKILWMREFAFPLSEMADRLGLTEEEVANRPTERALAALLGSIPPLSPEEPTPTLP
jgi:hypothetical protein